MLEIYHNVNFFNNGVPTDSELELVATIYDSDSLSEAFELTNSVSRYWGENIGVVSYKPNNRSTSVGDVVVINKTERWMVAPTGWKRI